MKTIVIVIVIFGFLLFVGCKNENKKVQTTASDINIEIDAPIESTIDNKAERIINEAISAHGGDLYNTADYSFVFRNREYRFTNDNDTYTYFVQDKSNKNSSDFIVDGKFDRYINEQSVELSKKDIDIYAGALNSVIYFATLPHKLNDKAVHKKYIEETTIKGEQYHVVEVNFGEKGGGKDHDDEYHYWINKSTKKMDYLAYNYNVNRGGVRFRSSYNRRVVDGITFQDYINWEATVGTLLNELPTLYEQGKLTELSRIKIENVINLNK